MSDDERKREAWVPFPVQCTGTVNPLSYYPIRCLNKATCRLVDPEGRINPGAYLCEAHKNAILFEYKTTLDEDWSTLPLQVGEEYDVPES